MTIAPTDLPDPMTLECPVCRKDGAWHFQHPEIMAQCTSIMAVRKQQRSRCLVCGGYDSGSQGDCKTYWATAEKDGMTPGMYHECCYNTALVEKNLPIVESVHIIWPSRKTGRYQATAMAEMSDGTLVDVLSWYSDEISFRADDFIGKNVNQVDDLFRKRDVHYLQS